MGKMHVTSESAGWDRTLGVDVTTVKKYTHRHILAMVLANKSFKYLFNFHHSQPFLLKGCVFYKCLSAFGGT